MATSDNFFTQYLKDETNKERFSDSLENSTFLDLVEQKKEDLGLKAEQKKLDFVNQTINLEEGGFDADTLNLFGRLASQPGFTFDAYETAKYDENNELIPYLGKIAPTDGSKRSKKWNLHRSALAKKLGIPRDYVTQGMLNEEAAKQAQNFKDLLYKGQDPDSPTVSVDIRQDGVGFFGRPLITVRNPVTGEIINEVMNTPENNAMFYSKYNKEAYAEGVLQLADAERSYNKSVGQGFWDSMGKGISSGIDNLQATGYGFAALITDFAGNEKLGNWFLDQYLRNIEEAQKNGAHLPGIEDIDWSNPTQVLSKLGALIGEAMPSIALMIGSGGIAGLVAKSAAKHGIKKFAADRVLSKGAQKIINKAANRGRAIGAYGSAMGMETGSIYGNVAEAGERDWKAQLGSLAGGTIAGALEAFYPLKLMRKLGMGKAGSKTLKSSLLKNSAGQNLKNIGKELLSGGLTEGSTEGMQFIVEEVTQDLIKEGHLPDYKSEEFKLGLLNSIVAGLVPGATFSGTISTVNELNNRIGGDKAALQRNLQEVRQEANEARDEAAQGTGNVETEKILTERVANIEAQAEALGIDLDDTYNTSTNLQKALFLSDALNQLEIEQKALPKGERNAEVLKAKETINTALEQLNTGSAGTEAGVKSQVIQSNLQRQLAKINSRFERLKKKFPQRTERYEAEQAKQIAKAEQVAANKQAKIDSKARRVSKVGVKVLRKTITESINKIKKINAKLKDPNISERQRKRLERTRNQLGIQIDNLSKDSTGQRIAMPKADIKKIETALNSFTFKNKRVKTKTNKELSKTLISAREVYNDYVATKDELSQEDLEDKKATLIDAYEKINEILTSLIADRENTNDPNSLKELDLQIASVQQMKEDILAEFETEESSKPKPKKPKTKPKEETEIVKPKLSLPKILAKRIFKFKDVIKLGANGELLNRAELIEALMAFYYLESNEKQKEEREVLENLPDKFLIEVAQKDKKLTQSHIDGRINEIKREYAKKLQKWARQHHFYIEDNLFDGDNNTAEAESYYADVWIPAELEALEAALKYGGSTRSDQEIKERIETLTAEQKEIRQARKDQTGIFAPQETNVDETLNSLDIDILNEGVDESILGSLNKEQKEQATIRNKVKDSFNEIKIKLKNAKKTLQDVHNEIIKGTGTEDKFKGIETYLEDAKNDEFTESQYDDFVLGLVLKLKAWKKAQAMFKKRKGNYAAYVNKNTYEVYSNQKQLPEGFNFNDYWYINEKSDQLISLLELEIQYAKNIKVVIANILDNVDSKVKTQKLNAKIIANQKKIDALIAKNQGNTGNLDNVKKPVTKPKVKKVELPESKYKDKDQAKSDQANKFIGIGAIGSSTMKYLKAWGKRGNTGTYNASDIVFISVNGQRKNRTKFDEQELQLALDAGATIITDNLTDRTRSYNIGEREVAEFLKNNNYEESNGNGVWKKRTITSAEVEEIILSEDELIDEDISTEDITKPKDKKVRAKRNKRLKAYQDRHQKLIDKLIADKKALVDILKGNNSEKGTNREPLNRVEIQDEIDALELKIKLHQAELDNLLKAEFKEKAGNHFLTKFGNTFAKLRDTVLRVTDLFRIRDIERDSFFSINENKNLNRRSILELLKKVGLEYSTTNKDGKKVRGKDFEYIRALLNQFDEFKTAFEKVNVGFDDKRDSTEGLYAKEAFKLFLDKDGNMPDEVIFAMMLSTMHYAAVNVGKSKFRPLFEIADLLYGDGKQADRLGKEEIGAWGNAGIFTKNVGKDIGLEMLDILNLQIEKDSEKEFLKNITKITEESSFRGVIIRDSGFRNTAAISLGLLAMQTARLVNPQKTKTGRNKKDSGLFRLRRGSYAVSLFDNPEMGFLNELQKKAEETGIEQFIEWNTIEINDSDLLKIFADNVENLEKIKGTQSDLSDISFVPPKNVQEKTDNSFFVLGKKIINLIRSLQGVKWIGKENELDLFNSLMNFDKNGKLVRDDEGQIVINDVLKQLIGYKNLDEQHSENRDAIEAANNEKLKDIEYIIDYYQNKDTKGLKGFYFRYKAQTQHRLRINSNTINPQRSKIMRALFNPVGSESTVTTDSDKAIFKLAVVQAFGYNIKTLEEGVKVFKQIYENTAVQEAINATPETFQNNLNEVLNVTVTRNGKEVSLVDGASTHILEALNALKNYSETETFTTTIGIETDGITNGYAIGLLQFLDGTPEELKEALERVGVFVDQKDAINTYEKFIASGKDDVYQAFSRKIVEDIQELSDDERAAVEVLHGNLLEDDGSLTKFARDLAKNPVMISNYGAGVEKVINNVIGKIIPDLYDTLAKHQTAYNKATTKAERDAAVDAITEIQERLSQSIKIKVDLVGKLTKNKLYDFKFSKDRKVQGKVLLGQQSKIEIYFQSIYADKETKIFRNALDTLLSPIKESREILTKIIEAEFFIFYSEFEKQTAEFPSGKLTNTAIRMHIAAQLADKLMPRMNSPWNDPANEQELIQLIKQVDAVAGRVVIRTKPFKNAIYSKTSKKWEWIRDENEVRVGANSATSDFATPGVSAVINMIQNMDSVVLGDLLDQKNVTKALPIYDAVISPIKDALKNAGLYNASFLYRNLNHVMLENALEQYDKLLVNAKEFGINLNEISDDLKINSYRGKQIVAELLEIEEKLADKELRIEKLKNKKKPTIKQTNILTAYINQVSKLRERQTKLEDEQSELSIEGLHETLVNRIQSRKDNLIALLAPKKENGFGNADNLSIKKLEALTRDKLNDLVARSWLSSQMYLPESILNPKLTPKIITKVVKKAKKKAKKIVTTGLTGNKLTQETIDGFKGAQDAAIWLANNKDESKYIRKIAKLLIPLLSDTIVVSSDFDRYDDSEDFKKTGRQRSFYRKSTEALRPNLVVVNLERGTPTLLHELIHAATQVILKTPPKDRTIRQNNAVKQIWNVRLAIKEAYERDLNVKGDIDNQEDQAMEYLLYGGKQRKKIVDDFRKKLTTEGKVAAEGAYDRFTLAEFLTQVLTSPYAQNYLKRKKIKNKTLWSKLVNSIRNLLNIKDDSLFDEALSVSIEAIESLKEDDQRSQGDLFDNTGKINEVIVANIMADAKRDERIAKGKNNINVYYGTGDNANFSNLAERPFEFEGREYVSVEHAYQTLKSGKFDETTFNKKWGDGIKITGRFKANQKTNINLMSRLMLASFEQNPDAQQALLDTGNASFTHNEGTGIWNKAFPTILERVRSKLKDDSIAKEKLSPFTWTSFIKELNEDEIKIIGGQNLVENYKNKEIVDFINNPTKLDKAVENADPGMEEDGPDIEARADFEFLTNLQKISNRLNFMRTSPTPEVQEQYNKLDDVSKLIYDATLVEIAKVNRETDALLDIATSRELNHKEGLRRADLKRRLTMLTTKLTQILDSDNDFIDLSDILESIDDIVDTELEKDVYSTNSLRENLTAIFDRLGLSSVDAYLNKGDQNVQEGHLKRVLTEIIAKAGILLDDTTVTLNASSVKAHGEANIGETSVDVNFNKFKPESYSEQTAQEVYVHELLHILTRFALTKDSRLRQKLERIRNEVKAEIEKEANPYELFLRKDANGKIITLTDEASEIAAAKAQYNYLFGDKVPADAVLDEFLAYSLTNKFMVEKLNTMDSKAVPLWSKEESDSVVEKILHFFTEIIERISGVLRGKTKPANLEQEIFELTKDIVAVNQSKRDELARALKIDKINGVMDKGNAIVRQFAADVASGVIKKGSDAYIAAVDKITKDGKIKGFLADVLYDSKLIAYFGSSYKDFVDNHPKVQEKLNVIFRNFKPNTLKNMSSLKADLFGGVDQDFIKLLYKSHNEVDSNRRQYKELTKEALQKVFKDYDSLTNPEKESLTKVFLKTDLSVLVESGEFTTEQVMELIQDETALDKLVLDYRKKLKINKNQHYRLQTSQLAKIMMTGKNNSYNQMLNATAIYARGKKSNRAYPKNKKDDEIRDLDIYISLLALRNKNLSNAKTEVTNVIKREFAADPTHNGIHGLINLHVSFKKESLKEGFNNNPTLMTKGYISSITDPDVSLVVEPDDEATNEEMRRRKYVFISKIDGIGTKPMNLWVIKNNPELTRTKGIVSMTSKQFKGTSLKEIFSRNQSTANAIMDNLNKFQNAQTKREAKGLLSPKYTAIPVINEKFEIVDYRITMTHAMAEKHLHQELSFDEVLPTMFSQLQDKIKSEQINNEAIKLLYQYGKKNYKKNPSKFINILDEKFQKEYYQPLPKQAKYQISRFVTINKETRKEEFWVERGYLDTVFGYVNPSVSNISFFNNKPKTKRYVKVTEKLIQEMVRLAVVNIVIKIPIVPAVNFASNFVTSFLYTGDPMYLIKKWREGIVELNKYKHDSKTLKLLDIEILSNPALENDAKTQKKREILVKKINRNPVSGFVDAGLFTSITEDINQNEFTYRNKVFNRIKAKGNKLVTGKVFDVANHAYLGEHTAIFKASMHFLQMSDFIARYALYKHQVEVKGINKDQAWKTMVETFVNYDQPLNRFVGYGNDMGAILFVKYWLRIQRAGLNLIKEKPLNVGLLFATQGLLGMDIETILDSNLLTGNFMPTLGGFEKIFEEVVIPPGLEILAGEGFG